MLGVFLPFPFLILLVPKLDILTLILYIDTDGCNKLRIQYEFWSRDTYQNGDYLLNVFRYFFIF